MSATPLPISISEDAKALLRERLAASGMASPIARITMAGMETPKAGAEDEADWTIRRRDLWTLVVADGAKHADGDPKVVVIDGLRFVSDYFPIRFDISAKDGRFRVAATA